MILKKLKIRIMIKNSIFTSKSIIAFALILLTSNGYFAQSPGGVSASGSNELWLDASRLTLSNNATVSPWTDVSGNNNHASSGTVERPLFKTNQINGKPAIKFDGVNDRLRTGSIAALNTNTITTFSVFNSAATNTGVVSMNAYTSGAGTASYTINGMYYSPSNSILNFSTRNADGSGANQLKNPYSGSVVLTSMIWNGSTSLISKLDGSINNSGVGGNAIPSGNLGVTLAANWTGNYYLDVLMAEHIVYSSALSSAEVNIVENYLAAKYNLTISNDMYAHQAVYGNDVIGLGQESDGNNLSAQGTSNLSLSIASLNDGEYIFAGHNNAGYSLNIVDVPSNYSRYNQVWQADVTGVPGTITVAFDVSTYSLGGQNNYVLFVDADGVFANGATEYVGVYNSGTVTFSNVVMTDDAYFTLANNTGEILSTGVTNDWHTETTWSCGCIPSILTDVNILNGHTVVISGQNAYVASLTINGSLTIAGSETLEVSEDFNNNNTFVAGTSTLLFKGSTAQNLNGTTQFHHLTINNTSGVSNLGSISVQGWLNVIAGTLNTGNSLTLLSNASGTAGVKRPEVGTVSGTVTLQRYLNEGESWYLLGPSVIGGTLEDWNQEFEMQGFQGSEWLGGSPSVYYYNQNNNVTSYYDGYVVPSNSTDVIPLTRGWQAYVGNDSYATGARTIDITGNLGLGFYSIVCLYQNKIGNIEEDGWSLIANPFAAPVSWSKITKSGLFDEAQYKKADGSSAVIDNNFILAPGEAFWVHYNPGAGGRVQFEVGDVAATLTDNYNNRMSNQQVFSEPVITFALTEKTTNYTDYCYVGFSDEATNDKDMLIDNYKLPQSNLYLPNIATIVNGKKLLKNILNSKSNIVVPIKIYYSISSGEKKEFTLNLSNVSSVLEQNKLIVLEDKLLNSFTTINKDSEIEFSMNDDINEPRFFLHISTPLEVSYKSVSCNGKNDGFAEAKTTDGSLTTFVWKNINGDLIKEEKNTDYSKLSGLIAGIYFVESHNSRQKIEIYNPEEIMASFTASYGGLDFGSSIESTQNDTLFVKTDDEIYFESIVTGANNYMWEFGDYTFSTLESPKHKYFNEGVYKVNLKASSLSCDVNSEVFIKVSKNNIQLANLFDEVNVIVKENNLNLFMNNNYSGVVSFEVLNSLGQTVYSSSKQIASNHIEEIKLNVSSGVYMLKIEGLNNSKTKKIVLN